MKSFIFEYLRTCFIAVFLLLTSALQAQTEQELKEYEQLYGKDSPEYATAEVNAANELARRGNFTEAIHLGEDALTIYENAFGKDNPDYAQALANVALYYSEYGNYEHALQLSTEARGICEAVFGREAPEYAQSLQSMAIIHTYLGNYTQAIELDTEALHIMEEMLGKENPLYTMSLNFLAGDNYLLGNYLEAIRLCTEALQLIEQMQGRENTDYAVTLNNLANDYYREGNYQEAIRLGQQATDIYATIVGKEHRDYAMSLNNLAGFHCALQHYDEAIRLQKEAVRINEQLFGTRHPRYAQSLSNLANDHALAGQFEEAIRLETEALAIREETLGKEHPDYETSISSLADYYYQHGDSTSLERYAIAASQSASQIVIKGFASLTAHERTLFWQKYSDWFSRRILQYAYRHPSSALIANAYDGVLLGKGLLLNSEQEVDRMLQESGDERLVRLYHQLRETRQLIEWQYGMPISDRTLNTDSLEKAANVLERALMRGSKVYGDYTRNMRIQWKDVQQQLRTEDVAVEFCSFATGKDSVLYTALVLRSGMTTPVQVPLFEQRQLPRSRSVYSDTSLSRLVWEPLAPWLEGAENIYFAPTGELYNIAIESLPLWTGKERMSERWHIYRLSSTRQLATSHQKRHLQRSVVFGGLQYRNATPLPATLTEAKYIHQTLLKGKVKDRIFTDSIGTEDRFKMLSGKKENLLHIATHGFYWQEIETATATPSVMTAGSSRPQYVEDKALTRSGLLFTGADVSDINHHLLVDADEGILTAKEISRMDLRDLDLVVLSACQSGLGEIRGDGVFGLQRGFKKAGANTLLMSLWKVDDHATQLLMQRFYDNLTVKRMSKCDALREAQQYVRDYEMVVEVKPSGRRPITIRQKMEAQRLAAMGPQYKKVRKYKAPYYWAAFVLLDGWQ